MSRAHQEAGAPEGDRRPGRVLVAMSGGVDSSVAAGLLQRSGHEVLGVYMSNGIEAAGSGSRRQGCCGLDDSLDARRVADRLGIPFYAVDFSSDFEGLIARFVASYREGRTPNPCITCNRDFKFGRLLGMAERFGASAVASGHYARLRETGGRYRVARAADRAKDQSYVLFSLPPSRLAQVMFPLGDLCKGEVRALAREWNLPVASKPESMEICFVPTGDYRDVVRQRAPDAMRPGVFVDADGRRLGEHVGTAAFTIGQRKGLPAGFPEPRYVTAIRPGSGEVEIGGREALLRGGLEIDDVTASGADPAACVGERLHVQLRAHHEAVPCTVVSGGEDRVSAHFDSPAQGVVPGQAAVFYRGDEIAFGGWIRGSIPVDATGAHV